MVTRVVFGRKVRVHAECVESFREDRKVGLIYPSYLVGGVVMSSPPSGRAGSNR